MASSGGTFDAMLEQTQAWLRAAADDSGRDVSVMAADVADLRASARELDRVLSEATSGAPDWEDFVAALHEARVELAHLLWHWRSLAAQAGEPELLQTDEY